MLDNLFVASVYCIEYDWSGHVSARNEQHQRPLAFISIFLLNDFAYTDRYDIRREKERGKKANVMHRPVRTTAFVVHVGNIFAGDVHGENEQIDCSARNTAHTAYGYWSNGIVSLSHIFTVCRLVLAALSAVDRFDTKRLHGHNDTKTRDAIRIHHRWDSTTRV